jgi:hypothetical protein
MVAAAARARTVRERAVAALLATGKVVAPVDVLVRMGLLAPDRLEQSSNGAGAGLTHVPYAVQCTHAGAPTA